MTPHEYAAKKLKLYRTSCCKVVAYHTGRAQAACSHCGKDVSLDIILIYDMYYQEAQLKENESNTGI